MDEIWILIFFSIAMLFGCYFAGMIPLIVNFSEEKLHLVSVLGAGLLVGTALAVIIPEGVNTLYEFQSGHIHQVEAKSADTSKTFGHSTKDEVLKTNSPNVSSKSNHNDVHTLIGISLVLGFLFMLVIDQLCGYHLKGTDDGKGRNKITATLGLVVHAAADGVALGAAATTSHTDIEFIVFLAIMLHKAPAAFGLVTFLLHDGMDHARIRRHLLVFSLAAPFLSLITYFGISQKGKETLSSMNATGIAMLFSAGTFLYVSTVHVLPEVTKKPSQSNLPSNANDVTSVDKGFTKSELCALITGTLLPGLLSVTHRH